MSVYLDYAATAPLRPEALEAMLPHFETAGGNPSAMYASGRAAREALEEARQRVAACIGADPSEIYFTSGGTESNNWALLGMDTDPRGIVTTAAEHHAVLDVCAHLQKTGTPVTYLGVNRDGTPDMEQLEAALAVGPALLSVMYANNEVGTVAPVKEIAELASRAGVPLHTDAVAAVGKVPVDVAGQGISMLSASGHKFGAPRGVGFLYVRTGLDVQNLLHGGRQERGRRPGTEDVAAASGLAAALSAACAEMDAEADRLSGLRKKLRTQLEAAGIQRFNGSGEGLPGLLNVCLPGIRSEAALVFLDGCGIECGAGAACTMGAGRPSHVLCAMGIPESEAACALRLSMGRETTEEDVAAAAGALRTLIERHSRRLRR